MTMMQEENQIVSHFLSISSFSISSFSISSFSISFSLFLFLLFLSFSFSLFLFLSITLSHTLSLSQSLSHTIDQQKFKKYRILLVAGKEYETGFAGSVCASLPSRGSVVSGFSLPSSCPTASRRNTITMMTFHDNSHVAVAVSFIFVAVRARNTTGPTLSKSTMDDSVATLRRELWFSVIGGMEGK
jgi:hypothetical protein